MNAPSSEPTETGEPPSPTLEIRARPRPVVRFRRGAIVAAAGLASVLVIGAAWMALEPPSFRSAAGADEPIALAPSPAEALAGAPATYGDVPQLGPPLPGDLGRPILEEQRQEGSVVSDPRREELAAEARARTRAEEQRIESERKAARESALLVGLSPRAPAARMTEQLGDGGEAGPAPTRNSPPVGGPKKGDGLVLHAGTVIPASLMTGVNSDAPGLVLAQVTENVLDSATGTRVLVPQGARLVGSSDQSVGFGQRRLRIVWREVVFPDGSVVDLGELPASDAAGRAGLEDRVDFHEGRLAKGVLLSSLLGVGTEIGFGRDESDLVRALREATQDRAGKAGDELVARNLDVPPTITIRPGMPVRAILAASLLLPAWKG